MSITSLPGTKVKPRVDFDAEIEAARADGDESFSGWYCVKTDPFPCPATDCGFVAHYMTAAHLIVVWPRIDDSALLGMANNAKLAGRNPRIVEYETGFGRAISWDAWVAMGRPIHGALKRPDEIGPEHTPRL